jgi:hypothetical protein
MIIHNYTFIYAAPALVEPGDNTTTEVEEDGFRFFQSACPAFSLTIMIEQIDLVGSCSLYASNQVQNPGEPRVCVGGVSVSVSVCVWGGGGVSGWVGMGVLQCGNELRV